MPVEIRGVAAEGFYTAWFLGAGVNKVSAVQSPDDDATSDIMEVTPGDRQSYTLAPSAIPAGSTINSVTVRQRQGNAWGAAGVNSFLRLAGVDNDGPANAVPGGVWTTFLDVIGRPGGGAWAWADLAGLEVGVLLTSVGGIFAHVTSLRVEIDWTAGGEVPYCIFDVCQVV